MDVNFSEWDSTLEDRAKEGASPESDPCSGWGCVRLMNSRKQRQKRSGQSKNLATGAGVNVTTLEKLAAADAFRSLGLDRRQALWQVKALANAPALPLFSWSETRETGDKADVRLPKMALSEHVVKDYQTLRLSLKAHPMVFLREGFRKARVLSCEECGVSKTGRASPSLCRSGAAAARLGQGRRVHDDRGRDGHREGRRLAKNARTLPQGRDDGAAYLDRRPHPEARGYNPYRVGEAHRQKRLAPASFRMGGRYESAVRKSR